MIFNEHSKIVGQHAAILSASKYNWINYTPEKLEEVYLNQMAVARGVQLHDLAHRMITLGVKAPKNNDYFNRFVNDAIGFKMNSEQVLYYSDNCFGTSDAISFNTKENLLRIHDLKTGVTKASFTQLEVYAALFCLEYKYNPEKINIDLRIYQNDAEDPNSPVKGEMPDPSRIQSIMAKIVEFDKQLKYIKGELVNGG